MSDPLWSVFYIKVRQRKIGSYSGHELVGTLYEKPPKNLAHGEYVVPIRLSGAEERLTRQAAIQALEIK